MKFARAGLLLALVATVRAAQVPFQLQGKEPADVNPSEYSVLSHPSLPAHSLRLRRVPDGVCERQPGVASWSGYLDVDLDMLYAEEEKNIGVKKTRPPPGIVEHFYFWAFESRNDKQTDPVTLWLNGGPGCSSFTGLLMELGPCSAVKPKNGVPGTQWNKYGWNTNSSMIFLDQPIGVGFSYASWKNVSREDAPPSRIFDTAHAARDVSAFLHLIGTDSANSVVTLSGIGSPLPTFTQFHMAGESYAGRYLPLIASQIVKDNQRLLAQPESGLLPIPLTSVLIGNGITAPIHQNKAMVEYACTNTTGHGPFLKKKTCDKMWKKWPVCKKMLKKCNLVPANGPYDREACVSATSYCSGAIGDVWGQTNTSVFDWQHKPEYDEEQWVGAFLNDKRTRLQLGVDPTGAGDKHDGTFVGCSDKVYADFETTGDGARESTWAVKHILDNGVRVMSYSGTRDYICNSIGNGKWTHSLDWAHGDEFRKAPLEPWHVEGRKEPAGYFRHYSNLTYATVESAGHFVPHDQPEAALVMFQRWQHSAIPGRLDV